MMSRKKSSASNLTPDEEELQHRVDSIMNDDAHLVEKRLPPKQLSNPDPAPDLGLGLIDDAATEQAIHEISIIDSDRLLADEDRLNGTT